MEFDKRGYNMDMNLPKSNPPEDHETISKRVLYDLLPPDKFEIQKEDKKDRGIDVHVELKIPTGERSSVHSNFRFIIQLKTYNGSKNKKDQLTISIDSSNINYLLNDAMPAYYILYHVKDKQLYYVRLDDLVKNIRQSGKNINDQKTHTIHFENHLTNEIIDQFYTETLSKGKFLRSLKEESLKMGELSVSKGLIVSENYAVITSDDIIEYIENHGPYLSNHGKWKELLDIHGKLPNKILTTSNYDLFVGISMYYTGEIYNSVTYFKKAIRKGGLNLERLDYARYFLSLSRYSLGIIDQREHENNLNEILTSEELKFFVRIGQKGREIFNENFEDFRSELLKFINYLTDTSSNLNLMSQVRDVAKCEWIKFEGERINSEYLYGLNALKVPELFLNDEFRRTFGREIQNWRTKWHQKTQSIIEEFHEGKKYFSYCLCLINHVQASFQFTMFSTYAKFIRTEKKEDLDRVESKNTVLSLLEPLDDAYRYFKFVNHIENLSVCLALKYELNHFLSQTDECHKIYDEFKTIATIYDLENHEANFELLVNGGTMHQNYERFLIDNIDRREKNQNEIENLVLKMKEMDLEEANKKNEFKDAYSIELFPISHFQFPKESLIDVFDILNICDDKRAQFKSMLEMEIIPVANILLNPIESEGYAGGNVNDSGITSWENIYRIRKAFFDRGFKRIHLR